MNEQSQTLALLIDGDNASPKIVDGLLAEIANYGTANVKRIYGDWTKPNLKGSPWENGYCESFNARFRDELLNGEVFYSLREAKILIEKWRRHYNTVRPHSAL